MQHLEGSGTSVLYI